MSENFSALEYKTQEEVLLVIRHVTVVLSVTGTQVVEGFIRKRREDGRMNTSTTSVSRFIAIFRLVVDQRWSGNYS